MHDLSRRALLGALAATAALPARADTWPTRPVRYVVPFPPGATSDNVTRLTARELQKRLDQTLIVENRAGAGGGLGTQQALRAAPDGYTLLNVTSAILSIVPRLSPVNYDPTRDLTPVAFQGEAYSLLAVHPESGIDSLDALLARARRDPGGVTYSSAGIGSFGHILGALLGQRGRAEVTHVPYPGSAPAVNATLARNVTFIFDPATLPLAQSGRLRPLAVFGPDRWDAVPDVPTLGELGYTGWPASLWFGFVAPAGTPEPIVARLNTAWNEALEDPEVDAVLRRLGLRPAALTPEQLKARIAHEWREVGELLATLRLSS